MKKFDSIRGALDFVAGVVIPAERSYCLSILGTNEKSKKQACTIQILPHDEVFEDDEGGLRMTLQLPFDAKSGMSPNHIRFLTMPGHEEFRFFDLGGIPCYALDLGEDADKALAKIGLVLSHVFDYPPGSPFECDVSWSWSGDMDELAEYEDEENREEGSESGDEEDGWGRCPFCDERGFISGGDWPEVCPHWVGVDDDCHGSEPICLLTEGETFERFREAMTAFEAFDSRKKKRLIASAPPDTARLLEAVNAWAGNYWKYLVIVEELEVDVTEPLFCTTYRCYFIADPASEAGRLKAMVEQSLQYLESKKVT